MEPKNIFDYINNYWSRNAGVMYNRFYDDSIYGRNIAEEEFKKSIPRDYLTPDYVAVSYWKKVSSLISLLDDEMIVDYKETAHVLPSSFFEKSDFNYNDRIIRIPAERMLEHRKFVVFAEAVQLIFIQSRDATSMVPFIYEDSREISTSDANGNQTVYKHNFGPSADASGWRLQIIQPKGWSWQSPVTSTTQPNTTMQATQRVTSLSPIVDPLIQQVVKNYSPTMDLNELNKIFKEIQETGSYLGLD